MMSFSSFRNMAATVCERVFSAGSKYVVVTSCLLTLSSCATPTTTATPEVDWPAELASFESRCADPAVVRCFGFEVSELAEEGGPIYWGHSRKPAGVFVNGRRPDASLDKRAELASDQFASGVTSLKFFMPSKSGAGHAGQFYANFADDFSVQFGEGDEFFVQWRQRFSSAFISNIYEPFSSWKQVIIGEGSRQDFHARSCSQLEVVVNNKGGAPAMYHSCRGKDGRSEGLHRNSTLNYVANEWMTFQVRVKIGTWYKNDRRYKNDSLIELWVAREGRSSRRVLSQRYDLANTSPDAEYGKVWLLPYLTGKRNTQKHADAFTWYDELIVSKARIADPAP